MARVQSDPVFVFNLISDLEWFQCKFIGKIKFRLLTTVSATLKSVTKSEAYLNFRICSKLQIAITFDLLNGFECRFLENDRLGEIFARPEGGGVRSSVVGPAWLRPADLLGLGAGGTGDGKGRDLSEIEELGESFETCTHTQIFVEKWRSYEGLKFSAMMGLCGSAKRKKMTWIVFLY